MKQIGVLLVVQTLCMHNTTTKKSEVIYNKKHDANKWAVALFRSSSKKLKKKKYTTFSSKITVHKATGVRSLIAVVC